MQRERASGCRTSAARKSGKAIRGAAGNLSTPANLSLLSLRLFLFSLISLLSSLLSAELFGIIIITTVDTHLSPTWHLRYLLGGVAEHCWYSPAWDLESDETVPPLLFTQIPVNWGPRLVLFEPRETDEASNCIPPTSLLRLIPSGTRRLPRVVVEGSFLRLTTTRQYRGKVWKHCPRESHEQLPERFLESPSSKPLRRSRPLKRAS